jgi:hypothetical protein
MSNPGKQIGRILVAVSVGVAAAGIAGPASIDSELAPGDGAVDLVAADDGQASLEGPSLGQRISRYLALETSHLAVGMTPTMAASLAVPSPPGTEVGSAAPSVLAGVAIWPAGDDWSIYARFGLTTSLADAATLSGRAGLAPAGLDTLGEDLLWGVGVGYQISERWSGRFDYQQVPVLLSPGLGLVPSTTRYDMLSIGLTYDF